MASNLKLVNVVATGNGKRTWSRQAILSWINNVLRSRIQKIEDLCTGAAYCCLLDILVPNSVKLNRIRIKAFQEADYIYNLIVLQRTLEKLKVNKYVPIHKLINGKFQDNYEFAVWFRLFFDANFTKMPDNYNVLQKRDYLPFVKGLTEEPTDESLQKPQPKPLYRSRRGAKPCGIIKPQPIAYDRCFSRKLRLTVMNIPMFARRQPTS